MKKAARLSSRPRMLRWETLTLLLAGVTVGTAVAFGTLSAFSAGMADTALPYGPPTTFLGILAAVAALAFGATALPARVALRTNPAEVIGAGE
jgi:putative ABC transport system permease protein